MNANEIKDILDLHRKWLYSEDGGERANLYGADLRGADLRGANLYGADLRGADLYGADLYGANLYGANLYGADLSDADLRGANLYGANLYGANLRDANLRDANLRGANLRGADLRGADLRDADLRGADLRELAAAQTSIVPEFGAFIGWKKAGNKIVKIEIAEDAKRSNATGRKCRCSKAKVLAIYDGDEEICEVDSGYDSGFIYRVGETVEVTDFDGDRWQECAPGIHFFITRAEAVDY